MKRIIRLAVLTALVFGAFAVHAQVNVNTTPQSTRQRVFTAVNSAQTFTVRNIGQTCHTVTYSTVNNPNIQIIIEATMDGTNWLPISFAGTGIFTGTFGTVYASGFFPSVRINLSFFSGAGGSSVTADYVGTSDCQEPTGRSFNASQPISRVMFQRQAASSNASFSLYPPFGNSAGTIMFDPSAALPAGCAFFVQIADNLGISKIVLTVNLPASGVDRIYTVPAYVANQILVTFISCGATTTVFNMTYVFQQPTIGMKAVGGADDVDSRFTLESDFHCSQSAVIQFTAGGAGANQIVALSANQAIRICHISFTNSVAINVSLVRGTGANCSTGTANVTGVYTNVTSLALDLGPGGALRVPIGEALCINVSGAATVGGVVSFAQF